MYDIDKLIESMDRMEKYRKTGESGNYDLTEFCKFVGYMMANHDIKLHTIHDGVQAMCYAFGEQVWDVVIHCGSYGHEDGLIEGYMGPFVTEYDDVSGWLTAREAIELVEKWEAEHEH